MLIFDTVSGKLVQPQLINSNVSFRAVGEESQEGGRNEEPSG